MKEKDRQKRAQLYEGWAFTFCKAAFLVLIFREYSLLALSGLATLFYLLGTFDGVKNWRCWAKPPYVTVFWAGIFLFEFYIHFMKR